MDKVRVSDDMLVSELSSPKATIVVSRTYPVEVRNHEFIEVPLFKSEVARVAVMRELTINLGNYQSARVGVTVALPCYPEQTDIDSAYAYAKQIAETKIQGELEYVESVKFRLLNADLAMKYEEVVKQNALLNETCENMKKQFTELQTKFDEVVKQNESLKKQIDELNKKQ